MKKYLLIAITALIIVSCKDENKELPYIGQKKVVNGVEQYHTIPDWKFMRQDSSWVTNKDLKDHIYVTDFFFMSCPTICPRVMKEMLKIYKAFEGDDRVKLVSFTIDPKRDTPERLQGYADKLGVNTNQWWFLNNENDITYELANEYFIVAYEDKDSPGGFDHSGKIILVDKEGHVRSFSEGTEPETTDGLIKDIKTLLASYEQ